MSRILRLSRPLRTSLGASLLAALAGAIGLLSAGVLRAETLTFLTWADYLDPEVVEEFQRETGVSIRFSYFESDDYRDELLAESDGVGYDLILVNGSMLGTYAESGWLAPVDMQKAANAARVQPRWRDAFNAAADYGVAYFWGTLGIGYRSDLVPEGFTRWSQFFAPDERLRGRLSMLKNARDVVGMALKSQGESANTSDRQAIRRAGELLMAQKPFVKSYEYVSLGEQSALVTGEIWAAMMYSGDALMVQQHDARIRYVVPEEGSNLWVDYLAVASRSPRQKLAWQFVNFLNRPEIAARNAIFVRYATPLDDAEALLPEAHRQDPVIYPGASVVSRSESYRDLPPRAQKAVNEVFAILLY